MKNVLLASLVLSVAATAQTYTLTSFGSQCGGVLHAQIHSSPNGDGVLLGVTGAMPDAMAIMVIGHVAPSPVQLPGSACLLLVDPRVTMLNATSATGTSRFAFRLPTTLPFRVDFQAVIFDFVGRHRIAESTDGVHLVAV